MQQLYWISAWLTGSPAVVNQSEGEHLTIMNYCTDIHRDLRKQSAVHTINGENALDPKDTCIDPVAGNASQTITEPPEPTSQEKQQLSIYILFEMIQIRNCVFGLNLQKQSISGQSIVNIAQKQQHCQLLSLFLSYSSSLVAVYVIIFFSMFMLLFSHFPSSFLEFSESVPVHSGSDPHV